ncbi:MAG TPA: lysozyme [Pseudonocardiaceae bacterium]|jgi:GH25 family lysozyme M1 (1,4-beta-N-acetylmuramidase)|nr:lysozyme [Pseudonocardiaceae bacterium]
MRHHLTGRILYAERSKIGCGRLRSRVIVVVATRNIALVALVTCLPVAVFAAPARATPVAPAITHPQDDWAGSQIARYEGTATPNAQNPQDLPVGPLAPVSMGDTAPAGFDVSHYQGAVDWPSAAAAGATFVYVKATESTNYVNPYFAQQYNGSYQAGLIRGAYHFATPDTSDGVTQANYFVNNGGGWSADGRTLPPAIDLEYNPYGDTCYGMTPVALVAWVHAFADQVRVRTGRYPTIYTSTRWWAMCMGNDASFGADPLWIARYNTVLGSLPPGWTAQAIWQFADAGAFPGDQDSFDGNVGQLHTLASG